MLTYSHDSSFFKDGFWQLHCDLLLDNPPQFKPEPILNTPFYRFMERTWILQQFPLAILLWLIGYFAHNIGHRSWHVQDAAVQGFNIKFCGLITMGECWHNNYHAFPGSAKLGLEQGQSDPGWWVLCILKKLKLVRNVVVADDLPERNNLRNIKNRF